MAKVTLNISQGFGKVPKKIKLLNTEEYLMLRNKAFKNDSVVPDASNARI